MNSVFKGIKFSDADIVEVDEFVPDGEYNPHNVRPWMIARSVGYSAFCVAVAFATCEQDAIDAAVDADKMDADMISMEEAEKREKEDGGEGVAYLGNASEPFDISDYLIFEMPNPPMSWVAMFEAREVK